MTNNEYTKRADDFLTRANATCSIRLIGQMINQDWKEKELRNAYDVTIKTPQGEMNLTFWDSAHNTEIYNMTLSEYAKKRFKCQYEYLTYSYKNKASRELKIKKSEAVPTTYDILACLQKYDVGTFEEFCSEFGYDEDSKTADKIYIAVIKEYKQLERIFTTQQIDELREIN